MMNTITSLQNPRVKEAAKLRDARSRAKQGRFLLDGTRELIQALAGGIEFEEAFVCEALCQSQEIQQAVERLGDTRAEIWHVTEPVFEKLAFGHRHEGVLAVAKTPRWTLEALQVARGSLIAVVEGLEKPGNVGAIVRSADAAGVSAVIVADARTDLFNPNCIRASLGTIFSTPVCTATAEEAIAWLAARGSKTFAARVDAIQSYTQADFAGDVAIVLGSEAAGLTRAWERLPVTPIKLPMLGAADSLNVSATAAVLFYEARRQRSV